MDSTSKKILTALKSSNHKRLMYSSHPYQQLQLEPDEFYRAVRYLKDTGYIEVISNQDGLSMGITLSHQGAHSLYFSLQALKRYLLDKWIDILALVVAVISLSVSITSCTRTASFKYELQQVQQSEVSSEESP